LCDIERIAGNYLRDDGWNQIETAPLDEDIALQMAVARLAHPMTMSAHNDRLDQFEKGNATNSRAGKVEAIPQPAVLALARLQDAHIGRPTMTDLSYTERWPPNLLAHHPEMRRRMVAGRRRNRRSAGRVGDRWV
jgi:hypothetical protein